MDETSPLSDFAAATKINKTNSGVHFSSDCKVLEFFTPSQIWIFTTFIKFPFWNGYETSPFYLINWVGFYSGSSTSRNALFCCYIWSLLIHLFQCFWSRTLVFGSHEVFSGAGRLRGDFLRQFYSGIMWSFDVERALRA